LSVAAALSRLHKAGTIKRLRRGVYYHPKSSVFGESKPNPETATDAILRAGKVTSVAGGPNSYNLLGLTNQVSGAMTRVADRRVRRRSVLGVPLKVEVRPGNSLKGVTAVERTFLDSLRHLQHIPDTTPAATLNRLRELLKNKTVSFTRLARFAQNEPPRVRALLGAVGESAQADQPEIIDGTALHHLRTSLNPLSAYKVHGLAHALPQSAAWNIS
jgi:predicted transcriptional regulator of viral defense system